MERKLATVLFVDLVGSTQLVASADPEVVRSRLTRFFDQVTHCITTHGGIVQKFAGDAVMAAFGVPFAHEDDPERAVRAALGIVEGVGKLGLEVRIGIESGEILSDETETTFATGLAINAAARLQQAAAAGRDHARPDRRAASPAASSSRRRSARRRRAASRTGSRRGVSSRSPTTSAAGSIVSVPLVGREEEIELLHNTFARVVRDNRVHLVTVFGAPGVGKSRLAREFIDGVERSTILTGRCLPYGEGVTYWAIAEMVKVAAGITDDDTVEAANEKLRNCCGDEAVADLLALASGVLDAVGGGERSASEIAWAAQTWATELADLQPLVLVFEDIHLAEEPMLDLIEHLASGVKDVPLLILCLARKDLLDERPAWGGGNVRSTSIELEALPLADSAQLLDALVAGESAELSDEQREAVLATTEGNPLFIEETVRMLLESGGESDGIPHTVQAMISARIDRLPETRAHRAATGRRRGARVLVGRDRGARRQPTIKGGELHDLVERDFLVREPRSTIRGEEAYRFKHVLIRDVAYAGLSKSSRALLHRQMAHWLGRAAGRGRARRDPRLPPRRGRPARTRSWRERSGRARAEAAEALEQAGRRALAREANNVARRLFSRAVELEPNARAALPRRARRLADVRLPDRLGRDARGERGGARSAGDHRVEVRALTALARVSLFRDADNACARELAGRALDVVEEGRRRGAVRRARGARHGLRTGRAISSEVERLANERLAIAERIGRADLQSGVLLELNDVYNARLETERAHEPLALAIELAGTSGSPTTRGWILRASGRQAAIEGRLADAEAALEEARALFAESGAALTLARTLNWLGVVALGQARPPRRRGDPARGDPAAQADPGSRDDGREPAPAGAGAARPGPPRRGGAASRSRRARPSAPGTSSSRSTTRLALGLVRAAQGRDDEAERLLRESEEILRPTGFRRHQIAPLEALAEFLRARDRDDEAVEVEEALAALLGGSRVSQPM